MISLMGYVYARISKGTLVIDVPGKMVQPGEALSGHIRVFAKRPIECRSLTVTLRCFIENSSRYTNSLNQPPLYHEQLLLLKERRMEPGQPQEFTFSFTIPSQLPPLRETIEKIMKKNMGKVDPNLLDLSVAFSHYINTWWVDAKLEAAGTDLFRRIHVQVNL